MKITAYLLFFLFFLPHDSYAEKANVEDVAVLRAAIRLDCAAKNGEYVILSSNTFLVAKIDVMSDNLNETVKSDLLRRNSVASPVPVVIECKGVKIVADTRIQELLKDRPTMTVLSRGFYEAFPGANSVMYLSLPGYSKDGRSALIHISYACGSSCGTSFIIHLRKTNGSWHVVAASNSWMS